MKDEGGEIEGEEWVWVANPVHRIYETGWIHMNIAWFETQEISWVNNMAKGPQMGSGLLMIGPDLLGAMQPAAIPKSSLHLPSFRVPNLSEAHNQSKQFTLSCTQIHTWSIGGKNACAKKKKKKKFKLKKYLKMVMAKTVKLRFSIYNEHMWLRQLTQS